LDSLTTVDKDFLKGITINGYLSLSSLTTVDKDFLKGTTINGSLSLDSLKTVDKDFLKGTTINGYLFLNSLTSVDREILNKNVKQLKEGYNKKKGYCFYDGILSKVILVSIKKGYTIYTTTNGFVVKKNKYTSHGITIKKAIQDLEFKVISEKLKKEPIKEDTEFTVKYYRLLTGACDIGCRNWMQNNEIGFRVINGETVELNPMKAKDLLPLLEKTKAYGLDKFRSLITF
jgi:hypothetical protein